jgi:hypothetical protein
MALIVAGNYANFTATGNVAAGPVNIIGILCATTSSGTVTLYDSATTGTSVPITGTITPAAGSYTPIPASTGSGLYIVVGGTINATVFFGPKS